MVQTLAAGRTSRSRAILDAALSWAESNRVAGSGDLEDFAYFLYAGKFYE